VIRTVEKRLMLFAIILLAPHCGSPKDAVAYCDKIAVGASVQSIPFSLTEDQSECLALSDSANPRTGVDPTALSCCAASQSSCGIDCSLYPSPVWRTVGSAREIGTNEQEWCCVVVQGDKVVARYQAYN